VDIKEYIASGTLEAYVLGSLPVEEQERVAADIARHPELAEEVAAIEEAMWQFAQANAQAPPAELKNKIWASLNKEEKTADIPPLHTKTIPLTPLATGNRVYSTGWQRAAVWIALVGSMLVNFILWSQRNNTQDAQVALKEQLDTMQHQMAMLQTSAQKQGEMLADSSMQAIVMQSMKPGHPMAATVYWSKAHGDAYLAFQKMPPPPSGMQYQMWVIQDGKPVSMGVLDKTLGIAQVSKLPMEVKAGQAFAISLEKEGGNLTPTEVYVLGKIS